MYLETTNIEGVLDSYSGYLHSGHPKNANRFDLARKLDREGAIAEAITFAMLQTMDLQPEIHEQVGIGGADFICCGSRGPLFKRSPEDRFVVEATSLSPDAVSNRSNIPNEVPEGIGGCAFGLLTQNICNKAKDKAPQLEGYAMPRVLAIASSHFGIAMLFDRGPAEWALVSDPHFRHEIGSKVADPSQYTDLDRSVFIKPGPEGSIIACRQSISAILLIAVYGNHSEVYGILHPEPAYPLNINLLSGLPFVRIGKWPITNGRITTEWVIGNPNGLNVRHFPARLATVRREGVAVLQEPELE